MTNIRLFVALAVSIFLASAAAGLGVSIGVQDAVEGTLLPIKSADQHGWTVEMQNPGSVTYQADLQFKVIQNGSTVFETWAPSARITPGGHADRTLSVTDPQVTGPATAVYTMHYGTERETVRRNITVPGSTKNDRFMIHSARKTSDALTLLLSTPEEVDRIALSVQGNPTWRFPQQRVATPGPMTAVTVPYHPTEYPGDRVQISIHSLEDSYSYTGTVSLEEETGVAATMTGMQVWAATHLPFVHMFFM